MAHYLYRRHRLCARDIVPHKSMKKPSLIDLLGLILNLVVFALLVATLHAQVPSAPTGLRIVAATADSPIDYPIDSVIPVPVTGTNGKFLAYWYPPSYIPHTNLIGNQLIPTRWAPEVSADGVNWMGSRNEFAYLPLRGIRVMNQACPTCLHFIEVYDATERVRIRLVAY